MFLDRPGARDVGANEVAERLRLTLRRYIEAQYHIRTESLIAERRELLERRATINQMAYVESTPSYALGDGYDNLDIPDHARNTLNQLSRLKLGIFGQPFRHQAEALEAFLGRGEDIIVATGTGSGKTESFLMPIICDMAAESAGDALYANIPACRALLLYPMNALVNDQLSRIRRIFGDEEAAAILKGNRERPVTFATYTGRTPYPGKRSGARDGRFIRPLFDEYYLPLLRDNPEIAEVLRKHGKWPAKDLLSFYNADRVEVGVYKTGNRKGKPRTSYHWRERLRTGLCDRELLTRQEVQERCPDILITNYSMLEYMLMRPIERSIFASTRHWLETVPGSSLTLVIDEAHLYYGAAGAEVALLIRRLMARLGIDRSRLRCILTSASLGDKATTSDTQTFAANLTGLPLTQTSHITVITGTEEERGEAAPASAAICSALISLDLRKLERFSVDLEDARGEVTRLADALGWSRSPSTGVVDELRDYMFERLSNFAPAQLLIEKSSGTAIGLTALARIIFLEQSDELAEAALSTLLALCTLARRAADGKVLLPTRLHLFFRGLPGLHACLDHQCSKRLAMRDDSIVGRLYTEPRTQCSCISQARVFELLTHRDCGSAFVGAYLSGPNGNFLWNERSPSLGDDSLKPTSRIQFLVDGEPHPDSRNDCRPAWIDIKTGRVEWRRPPNDAGFRKVYASANVSGDDDRGFVFTVCPVCQRGWNPDSPKIMDHQTKGEDPFASLVTEQLRAQPPQSPPTSRVPNGGRKVLLFSDGRQKAARLARDIPRAVEQDLFRVVLAVAVKSMRTLGREAKPTNELYVAFLSVLADNSLLLFDRADRKRLDDDVRTYAHDYGDDLATALADLSSVVQPPQRYNYHLLRQLCSEFYSITDVTIGFVAPAIRELTRLKETVFNIAGDAEDALPLAVAWINSGLNVYALNSRIENAVRRNALGYNRGRWVASGHFDKPFREALGTRFGLTGQKIEAIEKCLAGALAEQGGEPDGCVLDPRKVAITIDLDKPWFHCARCTRLAPLRFRGRCLHCGHDTVEELSPSSSPYIEARKGYWRSPVERALAGGSLEGVAVEEHTAQLSHRDKASVHATTERYELRFQDLLIDGDRPIDVLSCTTTMEVGIDIGSLLAVGLRNVPPQRANYQQRAGRAGRRGAGVSSVVTYAQNGPHDSYYFQDPTKIIAGTAPSPRLKLDNPKIARRHLNSFLFQTYFNAAIDEGRLAPNGDTSSLFKALGRTDEFFHSPKSQIGLTTFEEWVRSNVLDGSAPVCSLIASWLPDAVLIDTETKEHWIGKSTLALLRTLRDFRKTVRKPDGTPLRESESEEDSEDSPEPGHETKEWLLDFLFEANLLPSYAFPTNLAGFMIEEYAWRDDYQDVRVKELPQQSMDKALSEYAPGRLVVINKETYRSAGVAASVLPESTRDRAEPLFRDKHTLYYCVRCTYVQDGSGREDCPICGSVLEAHVTIQPEVFHPERAKALDDDDRDQEITYATMAQFPVPVGGDLQRLDRLGIHCQAAHAADQRLITVNKGIERHRGGHSGFWVCNKCGLSTPEDKAPVQHDRPYLIPHYRGARIARCDGQFEHVYLGSIFKTDLVLLRFDLTAPIIAETSDGLERNVIEDVLYTLADALSISAALHPELDLDPRELGNGFRIIPDVSGQRKFVDVYLYDTSSGGAGYSELAALHMAGIMRNAVTLLEDCPAQCERSCQECLRHFYNQHVQNRLDRRLGAQFLRYALGGATPQRDSVDHQARKLAPLVRILELEGRNCETHVTLGDAIVPMVVTADARNVAVGIVPGLIRDDSLTAQPWEEAAQAAGYQVVRLNDYVLARNLPDSQRRVNEALR